MEEVTNQKKLTRELEFDHRKITLVYVLGNIYLSELRSGLHLV
jgi:hypothetical protein